jgi:nitroimidazol reductase NimA-like FMN-containing flavoprotein (pyridoxamine 5'-phosphate oxidase superfamily)
MATAICTNAGRRSPAAIPIPSWVARMTGPENISELVLSNRPISDDPGGPKELDMEETRAMPELSPTPRTTLKRRPQRGSYDRAAIDAILDEAFLCHLAWQADGEPWCIPTVHARVGDALYVHGAAGNRALRALRDGARACLVVTLVDGLVVSRSAFHSSVNYRSVIVYGAAEEVSDPSEKQAAFRAIVEAVIPKRFADVRPPSQKEIDQTLVLRLPLDEASAKVRTGAPIEDEEDYDLPCWAGVLPLALRAGEPVGDPRLAPGTPVPDYLRHYARPRRELSESDSASTAGSSGQSWPGAGIGAR